MYKCMYVSVVAATGTAAAVVSPVFISYSSASVAAVLSLFTPRFYFSINKEAKKTLKNHLKSRENNYRLSACVCAFSVQRAQHIFGLRVLPLYFNSNEEKPLKSERR